MAKKKKSPFILLSLGIGVIGIGAGTYSLVPSFFCFHSSSTQSPVPLSIAVVDINKIKNNSKVFQSFKETLEDLNAKIHREVLERETKLRLEYEELKKREEQDKEPTPEVLKQKTELDKKYAALEKVVQTRKEELDQKYTKGLTDIK